MTDDDLFLGVDVGTGSARAGIFTGSGHMLSQAAHPIRLWREGETVVEQSSADIWAAVCRAVTDALAQTDVDPSRISGIGFDATCSLVVIGPDGAALTASKSGDPARDVIVWMDHRAQAQAGTINTIGGTPLAYVGNRISPEMELPKLLWLKENLPESFARAVIHGSDRLSDVARHRIRRAVSLHRHLQMDLPAASRGLGYGLFAENWSGHLGRQRLCPHRFPDCGPGNSLGERFVPIGVR